MRVLLVKTSSLGDVIHTLPALTDAARAIPGIQFDWVVEEGFAEIPAWHPAVARVIPVAIRRWRKNLWQTLRNGEWRRFKQRLKEVDYDLVIDAQGLLEECLADPLRGQDAGRRSRSRLGARAARQPLLSPCLSGRLGTACGGAHAPVVRPGAGLPVARVGRGDYGLDREQLADADPGAPYLVFLHGTTWDTKHWPEAYWRELAERMCERGWSVRLPWGSAAERERAGRLAAGLENAAVLPRLSLAGMAKVLAGARLRGGGYRPRSPGGGAGRADAVAVRPDQSWLHRRLRAFPGPPGQRLPCAPCLKKTCTYQPTEEDRKLFDLKREQPLCFTRLNPQRVATQLEAMLLAPETSDDPGVHPLQILPLRRPAA